MEVQSYTIGTEDEARAFLTDLLKHPEYQSRGVIEVRCAKMVKDPAGLASRKWRALFLKEEGSDGRPEADLYP